MNYRDRYTTKEFLLKRFKKTFIPFICWSLIGVIYFIFIKKSLPISTLNIKTLINDILNYEYIYIYWFFPVIFSIYLVMPLLTAVKDELKRNVFTYILIICLIINSLLPFVNNVFNLEINLPITVSIGSKYLTYVLIGYLLHTNKLNKKLEYTIYILGLLGLLLHIFGTYTLSIEASKIIKTYKGYNNLPCIL